MIDFDFADRINTEAYQAGLHDGYQAGLRDGYQQALDDIKRRLLELSNIKSPENREKEGNK